MAVVIPALDCSIRLSESEVRLDYSLLAASLSGTPRRTFAVAGVKEVRLSPPGALLPGRVEVVLDDAALTVRFAPHQEGEAHRFAEALEQARRGELPAAAQGPAGLTGTALAVAARSSRGRTGEPERFEAAMAEENGIGAAESLASAGQLAALLPESGVLLAHNAQLVLGELLRAGLIDRPAEFGCTLAYARAVLPEAPEHSLEALSRELDVEGSPAEQVVGVFAALAARAGANGDVAEIFAGQGLRLGRVDPQSGVVFPVLDQRDARATGGLGAGSQTSAAAGGRSVEGAGGAEDSSPDTSSSGAEGSGPVSGGPAARQRGGKNRGPAPWAAVATPDTIPEPNPKADPQGLLFGETVVLTGDFAPYDKSQLWAGLAHQGAQVAKNVTKKTTILVLGAWKTVTSKEKRARELIEKGQEIQLWPAEDLYRTLGLNEEPPF